MTANLESCVYNCYYEKILLTTIRLKKRKNYSFKTLFTIPVNLI